MNHRGKRNEAYEQGNDPVMLSSADIPQAFPDDAPQKLKVEPRQGRKTTSTASSNNSWIVSFIFLMAIVLVAAYFLVSHHEARMMEDLRRDLIHKEVEPLSQRWQDKYSKLQLESEELKGFAADYATLKDENDRLRRKQEQKENEEKQHPENSVEYLTKYKKKMQANIQLLSKTLLLEKFGPGPHQVEITLAFHDDFPKGKDSDTETAKILIELAPVDEMPHAVYWFLEQVTRQLYDGCSFHRNAGHVVQGGPAPNFLSPPNPKLYKRFVEAGFAGILFQEYSPNFPHKKYTMGLAGRPGGPDLYFSTRDNSLLHGPGGQKSYEDPSEADSCFAKVVEGFDVVDRMQLGPVKTGNYRAFVNNVAIVSMRRIDTSMGNEEQWGNR